MLTLVTLQVMRLLGSQRMNEKLGAKNAELVSEGITEIHDVGRLLRHYVMNDLCREGSLTMHAGKRRRIIEDT